MYPSISAKQFQRLILNWFDLYGRKNLPWQFDKTPYRVWISEIMLQQTQVSTVIPYFERFMQRFPTLHDLAQASVDDVLHLWTGLGYYSRARNLHRAAKMMVEQFGGVFPHNLARMMSLPGIGQSTAGAILAIAFNVCAPILDGNVKRVLTRFTGITDAIDDKKVQERLWQLAQMYTPEQKVADYTQAMMDLGATICTRGKPQCEQCPLKNYCLACCKGIAAHLPKKKMKPKLPVRAASFLIVQAGDQVLLHKRPEQGIWGGLWSLPQMNGQQELAAVKRYCRTNLKITIKEGYALPGFRHTFSHYHLDIFPFLMAIDKKPSKVMEGTTQIWYNLQHPNPVGLPRPVKKLLEGLANEIHPLYEIKQTS